MHSNFIDFFLTPDGGSARKVKMDVAREAPGLYRIVGTWPELMAQAEAAYLLPPVQDDWSEKLIVAARRQNDAFWASSMRIASSETLAELDAAIHRLLEAMGPGVKWSSAMDKIPQETRLYRRLSDLRQLLKSISGLPGALQQMASLLAAQQPPLRTIRVYAVESLMHFNEWQAAVLKKLNDDALPPDPRMQSILETSLVSPETCNPALKAAQDLYRSNVKPPQTRDGVRVVKLRDSLAEAEIAAGLIQHALSNGCRMTDMGILLPDDPLSLMAVENVFNGCGLSLAGFHRSAGQRDLGRETLRAFLLCLRKPAPIMAIATLLTSPLMPWSMKQGHAMAQAVMDGNVRLRSIKIPSAARKIMDILEGSTSMPLELQKQLKQVDKLLAGKETFYEHAKRAGDTINRLQSALSTMAHLDWDSLLSLTAPEYLRMSQSSDYWQEAIAVFHEGRLPWCRVAHLFVLGFNEGHYPSGAGPSAVFNDAEWEEIYQTGWRVLTNDLIRKRQRSLFAEQLATAGETLTILLACRDAGGKALEPSSSLVFLSRSLGVEPEALILDVDRSKDIAQITDLPLADIAPPSPPRELIASDLELNVDLLKTFGPKKGGLAPLSPSAADTLMVSPFAWLLGRLGCDPRVWGTDDFDVLKAGTLVHRVFEELFEAGQPLPSEEDISKKIPGILRERVLQIAPFLRSQDWRVERLKFESEILRAAIHWKKLLASCRADVVAAEQWLRGFHGDVPLHGQADLLLRLPSGKLLVVDYKKSSSGKRRDRMRSGFDLQAHLYRLMIQSGGLPEFESIPEDIGIVYYLLNDTTALADSPVNSDDTIPGWEVPSEDISSRAMQHLDQRLYQIRQGTIQLNTAEDENWWSDNASLPVYALDNTPLLRLFMRTEELLS